jgi:hypothetical protein
MPGFLLALLVLFFAVTVLGQDIGGLFSREYVNAPGPGDVLWIC